jgi:hypothetical protein
VKLMIEMFFEKWFFLAHILGYCNIIII